VVTRAVHDWTALDPARLAWLADCARRHAAGDWGDVDRHDWAANDAAVRHGCGRVLSAYQVPRHLADTAVEERLWVMTDDVEHPGAATTISWPSDY
jgi:hypothetical protein